MIRFACLLLLCGACVADDLQLADDGWHSWAFRTQANESKSCCYRISAGREKTTGCQLDDTPGAFSVKTDTQETATSMRVYAKTQLGELSEVHVYSASCPVTARTTIDDLGLLEQQQSLDWFERSLDAPRDTRSSVILGVAWHAGEPAFTLLRELTKPPHSLAVRKDAIFWMAHRHDPRARPIIEQVIAADSSNELREHAVFSLSQMKDSTGALLDILADASADLTIRKQALFWLAQSESPEAFAAIDRLLDP